MTRYEICCIRGGQSAHFVKEHLRAVPAGVQTFCGERAMPSPMPTLPKVCKRCLMRVVNDVNRERRREES